MDHNQAFYLGGTVGIVIGLFLMGIVWMISVSNTHDNRYNQYISYMTGCTRTETKEQCRTAFAVLVFPYDKKVLNNGVNQN